MRIFSYLAILMCFAGCSYFNDPGSELILNLDNEFEVEMKEHLIPGGRDLRFSITSLSRVDCEDAELTLETERSGDAISITISDIVTTPECSGGTSFPEGEALFQVRRKQYDLMIQVKEQVSQQGLLDVSDTEYQINLDNTKGFVVDRTVLKKIPENFAWGYIQPIDDEQKTFVYDFLSTNGLVYRPLVNLAPGHYSYFNISEDGTITIEDKPYSGMSEEIGFTNVDLAKIKPIIAQFKDANPAIKITMNFSDGTIL